jgi:hypothetical protein
MHAPAFELKANPIQAKKIYRGMTDAGGVPATGETKRKLGVTMPDDLDVDEKGVAKHNEKGMSTSPDSPMNLPEHRRDKEWEGTGKDPVWEIDESNLHTELLDWHEDKPGKHGIVRPKKDMPYATFKAALEGTQSNWKRAKKQ